MTQPGTVEPTNVPVAVLYAAECLVHSRDRERMRRWLRQFTPEQRKTIRDHLNALPRVWETW